MELISPIKTALSNLLFSTCDTQPEFTECWFLASYQETSIPGSMRLQVTITLPAKPEAASVVYYAVIPDRTQMSVDEAYSRFFEAMSKAIAANRNPFGV